MMVDMPFLRRAIGVGSILWSVALPAAAFSVVRAPSMIGYRFAFVVYGVGAVVCHQRPDRSFHMWTVALPVCARCLGIYAGAAVAYGAYVSRWFTSYVVSAFHYRPRYFVAS